MSIFLLKSDGDTPQNIYLLCFVQVMCFIHYENNICTVTAFHSVCVFFQTDVSRLIYARLAKNSQVSISGFNRQTVWASFWMYNIWGCVAVCSSNVFVAMWQRSPDTCCEWGLPYGDSREGWPGTAMPYGHLRPQWVKVTYWVQCPANSYPFNAQPVITEIWLNPKSRSWVRSKFKAT